MVTIFIAAVGAWFLSVTFVSGAIKGHIKNPGKFWYKHGIPNALIFSIAASGTLFSSFDQQFSFAAFLFIWITFSLSSLPISLQIKKL